MTRTARGFGGLVLVVVVALAYAALWVPQGLDVTDDGLHLTYQRTLLGHDGIPIDGWGVFVWGSDLVGAAWLWLTGGLGLLGARLGWVALVALSAAVTARILVRFFPPRSAVLAVIVSIPMILATGRTLIDYNGVPTLFLLLAIDALTSGRDGPSAWRDAVAGLCFWLATMARLPAAPLVVVVVAVAVVSLGGRSRSHARRVFAAYVVAALACVAWLAVAGRLGEVLGLVGLSDAGSTHSVGQIARVAVEHALGIVGFAVASLALAWGSRRVDVARSPGSRVRWAVTFAIVVALVVVSIWLSGPDATGRRWSWLLGGGSIATLVRTPRDETGRPKFALLALGLLVAFAACLGSDNGFTKLNRGLWLALPTAILVGSELIGRVRGGRTVGHALLVALAVGGVAIRIVSPYRDAPDRRHLVASVDDPRLVGIRTTPDRARAVASLLAELDRRVRPGDVVLAYTDTPLVHYLTETVPALGYAWPDRLTSEEITRRLATLGHAHAMPIVAVRALCDTNSTSWPDGSSAEGGSAPLRDPARLIGAWLDQRGYRAVWSSGDFEVLAR